MKLREFKNWLEELGFGYGFGEGEYGADYDVEVAKDNLVWKYTIKTAGLAFMNYVYQWAPVVADDCGEPVHRYTTLDGYTVDIVIV